MAENNISAEYIYIFKQDGNQRNRNNPDHTESVCQETTAEELNALFDISILMGLNPLPQFKVY